MGEDIFNLQQKLIFCVNMIDTLNKTIAEVATGLADIQKKARQGELISVKQAANMLGVSEGMIRHKINSGQLSKVYIGSCLRVKTEEVMAINDKYEPRGYGRI